MAYTKKQYIMSDLSLVLLDTTEDLLKILARLLSQLGK